MKSKEYNFKYSYLYPFMGLLLYFILALLLFYLLKIRSDFFNLYTSAYFLLFAFLLEAIFHYNAALDLEIPRFIFLFEHLFFLVILLFFSGRLQGLDNIFSLSNIDIYLFWLVSIFLWFQVYDFSRLFGYFRKDFIKIFDQSHQVRSLDEFRRLLDYPLIWPKIIAKISWLNLPLVILWAVMGRMNINFIYLTLIFLVIEVFFISLSYLDKKKIDWRVNGIEESKSVRRGWHRFLLIFIISALLIAFLLPANYQPLPMDQIKSWLHSKLVLREMPQIPAGNIRRQDMEEGDLSVQSELMIRILEMIFLVFQLILNILFLLLVLIFILFLIKSELSRIKNIPQFFKAFYRFFINFFREFFRTIKDFNFDLSSSWKRRQEKKEQKKSARYREEELKNIDLSDNSHSIIIRIYNSLLKLLSLKGLGRNPASTPYEYSSFLEGKYQDLKEEIKELTDIFVETAYSNHSLGKNAVKAAKSIWKIIKKKI